MAKEIKSKKQTSLIGKAWSQFPPHSKNLDLNIVSGTSKVISDILALILTKKGEASFLHPNYGMNPDLFSPLSSYDPDVFSEKLEEQIKTWVDSIENVSVETDKNSFNNELEGLIVIIALKTIKSPSKNLLTFDYYQYQGAIMSNNIQEFLDSVAIDDERFKELKDGN